MERAGNAVSRTFGAIGMGIREDLLRVYGGPVEAEAAIKEAMKDRDALEMWASIVTAKRHRLDNGFGFADEYGSEFSFDDLEPSLRELNTQSIAAAMLVWNAEQERRIS